LLEVPLLFHILLERLPYLKITQKTLTGKKMLGL